MTKRLRHQPLTLTHRAAYGAAGVAALAGWTVAYATSLYLTAPQVLDQYGMLIHQANDPELMLAGWWLMGGSLAVIFLPLLLAERLSARRT
jgi:hypothetical protein